MTPEQALKSIGLQDKEIAIYLACLELGQESVAAIARKAAVKRPTAYLVLESLRERGLVNTATRGQRTIFGVEAPAKLLGILRERERSLQTVLPYLEALNNRAVAKPRIRFYEGREGVAQIYAEMMSAPEIRFWGSMASILPGFSDVIEGFIQISNRRKPRVYDLLTDTPQDRAYAARAIRPGYEVRFFPKEAAVTVDSILAGDKLAMNAFAPEPHGLIIESPAIATSFRSLWELAWRGATLYHAASSKRRPNR